MVFKVDIVLIIKSSTWRASEFLDNFNWRDHVCNDVFGGKFLVEESILEFHSVPRPHVDMELRISLDVLPGILMLIVVEELSRGSEIRLASLLRSVNWILGLNIDSGDDSHPNRFTLGIMINNLCIVILVQTRHANSNPLVLLQLHSWCFVYLINSRSFFLRHLQNGPLENCSYSLNSISDMHLLISLYIKRTFERITDCSWKNTKTLFCILQSKILVHQLNDCFSLTTLLAFHLEQEGIFVCRE